MHKALDYRLIAHYNNNINSTNEGETNEQLPSTHQTKDGYTLLSISRFRDGEENVIHGYKGRHFATVKAAQKSTDTYLAKIAA
ncbi:MAG: hypothetical protein IPH54_23515 [Rhodoferax sp.]|nr:hypothetical protein [Rhodoferax sp.]